MARSLSRSRAQAAAQQFSGQLLCWRSCQFRLEHANALSGMRKGRGGNHRQLPPCSIARGNTHRPPSPPRRAAASQHLPFSCPSAHLFTARLPPSPLLPLSVAGEEHQDEPHDCDAPRLPALHQEVPAVREAPHQHLRPHLPLLPLQRGRQCHHRPVQVRGWRLPRWRFGWRGCILARHASMREGGLRKRGAPTS